MSEWIVIHEDYSEWSWPPREPDPTPREAILRGQGPLGRMLVVSTADDPNPRPHHVITDMYGRKRRIPL